MELGIILQILAVMLVARCSSNPASSTSQCNAPAGGNSAVQYSPPGDVLNDIPATPAGYRTLVFYNNHPTQTVWVGGFARQWNVAKTPLTGEITGFELGPKSRKIIVTEPFQSGRFWPRLGCEYTSYLASETPYPGQPQKFKCAIGDCGSAVTGYGVQCNGGTGQPSNLFEPTLPSDSSNDFYDLSNVDGFVAGMNVQPLPGRFQAATGSVSTQYNCGTAQCSNFNFSQCPPELYSNSSGYEICMSIWSAVNDQAQVAQYAVLQSIYNTQSLSKDLNTFYLVGCSCGPASAGGCTDSTSYYCCSPYNTPISGQGGICHVEDWPTPSASWCTSAGVSSANCTYANVFKAQCSDAYSWQFNDSESTYQCNQADYLVTFFPEC